MNKFLLLIAVFFNLQVAHAELVETKTLEQCFSHAKAATEHTPNYKVLYVFDIDNTVLQLNSHFGSVQWFRWQRDLLETNSPLRVAKTMDELLEKQGFIYAVSRAHTPEQSTAARIRFLQQKERHPVMYHTSRSLDVRDATERELKRNNLLPLSMFAQSFADDFDYGSQGTENQRPVSFRNGIYMTAGQDKGVYLHLLLDKIGFTPMHIVFVDDEEKNLKNVEREFAGKIPTTLCRYSAVDAKVNEFNVSDKSEVNRLWKEFYSLISKL